MHGTKFIDTGNYRTLIIAGIGTIGKSLVTLGGDHFSSFEYTITVDKDVACYMPLENSNIVCMAGDITEPQFLKTLMALIPGPSLFVNLCSGTNNVRIRQNLARHNTAYLDSCASATMNPGEYRFSRLMPYTYTEIASSRPHWLCWGINPGLVEIITRRILADLPESSSQAYDVAVFEFDRLKTRGTANKAAVGWCPEALVEEIMLAPSLEIVNGRLQEDSNTGTRECMVSWDDQIIPAKIVGHEDIWNLLEIPGVKNGSFYYSLSPEVMDILSMDDPKIARSMLRIPGKGDIISGLEQVAVQVREKNLAQHKTLVWTEDHGETWKKHGVNAVQYQTAKSLLLAILLLQHTGYGLIPHSFNASTLPITSHDWPIIDHLMHELGITWQDGAYLDLQVARC